VITTSQALEAPHCGPYRATHDPERLAGNSVTERLSDQSVRLRIGI